MLKDAKDDRRKTRDKDKDRDRRKDRHKEEVIDDKKPSSKKRDGKVWALKNLKFKTAHVLYLV